MFQYDFEKLKDAIQFNVVEVLPSDNAQLDEEIHNLVNLANKSGERIRHYIGFEISGKVHIGTGIASALKIKKLQDAGVKCTIWLADYHTWLNNKLDGQFETIRKVAREYFGPVMSKCLETVGCNIDDIDIWLADDIYATRVNGETFWTFDMKVGKELTLNRVLKSISIMGKEAGDNVEFSTLRYPVLQVTDAFFMQTHIVHAGLDQRKCHVLMRETSPKLDGKFTLKLGGESIKPIAVHHKLLMSLEKPKTTDGETATEVNKMSKSRPDSAIWVHDSESEVARKLAQAYCPMPQEGQSLEDIKSEQKWNPLLDWAANMIYPGGQIVSVLRPEKFGGDKTYNTFQELEADYFSGKLHALDLKSGIAKSLASWFKPIYDWSVANQAIIDFIATVKK